MSRQGLRLRLRPIFLFCSVLGGMDAQDPLRDSHAGRIQGIGVPEGPQAPGVGGITATTETPTARARARPPVWGCAGGHLGAAGEGMGLRSQIADPMAQHPPRVVPNLPRGTPTTRRGIMSKNRTIEQQQ